MRLGVYADLVYRRDDGGVSTDRAFVNFVTGLRAFLDEVVLFGRLDREAGRSPYPIPDERVRLVALPHYASLAEPRAALGALARARAAVRGELPRLDALWLFGPHPLAVLLAHDARRAGVPAFLGVRQDLPAYAAARFGRVQQAWALPAAAALELAYRRLARRAPTIVVGADLAARYHGSLVTGFSLVPAEAVVPLEEAVSRPWGGELTLVSVGRLDPEKNPLLLADVLAQLSPRWQLVVAGDGPLRDALAHRARERGVERRLELLGYVPNGPRLRDVYRSGHAFLHVSLTEGLPQVLFEAQAAGLPIVATDVGGVRSGLGGGSGGLLVPPADAAAAAAAITRLESDPELRRRLIAAGNENARRETMEAQLERIAAFLRAGVQPSRRARAVREKSSS